MATTNFGVNDAMANKLWSKKLSVETSKAIAIAPLMGTSSNSIIQIKNELQKSSGDKVTFGLRKQLIGDGVSENETLQGNEEALSTYSDSLMINELAHAVEVRNDGNTIDAQRVPFNLRQEANDGLTDWYSDRMSMMAFIHWGGYTAAKLPFEGRLINLKPVHYGFNDPISPSAERIIRAGGKATDEELTEDDIFDLTLIDKAVERAKLANPKIRPVNVNGDKMYVMYLHTTQVTAMRINTSDGQWQDITKAAYAGSRAKNPIFDGSLGVYNGVILREAEHVVPGVSSNDKMVDTVRRAVLLGAQSAVVAYGMKNNVDKFKRVEELFDYQRQLGVSVQTILGMKKTVFDKQDFGTIVVSTYAKPAE